MNLSIVIELHNDAEGLEALLSSARVAFNEVAIEVILVDDESSDEVSAKAQSFVDEYGITYVRHMGSGMASCRNRGMELATEDYVLFLDTNVEFLADAQEHLEKMIAEAAKQKDVAMLVAPVVVSTDENFQQESFSAMDHYDLFKAYLDGSLVLHSGGVLFKREELLGLRWDSRFRNFSSSLFLARTLMILPSQFLAKPFMKELKEETFEHCQHHYVESIPEIVDAFFDPTMFPAKLNSLKRSFVAREYWKMGLHLLEDKQKKKAKKCFFRAALAEPKRFFRREFYQKVF